MRGCGLADRADRPIRGDPFARGVSQHRRQIDDAGGLIERGGLDGRDLMLAERLAHDIEPACERGIAEQPLRRVGRFGFDRPDQGFSGLESSICALASAAANEAID